MARCLSSLRPERRGGCSPRARVCAYGTEQRDTRGLCRPHPAPQTHPRVSRSCAVDALQAMLLRGGNEDVVRRVELEGGWQLLRTSAGHEEGVTRLAR